MLSHTMMVSQVWISSQVAREWATPRVLSGELVPGAQPRTLAHLPAAHIAGVAGYFVGPGYEFANMIPSMDAC
jgi:4-coumarate--CoA ligase